MTKLSILAFTQLSPRHYHHNHKGMAPYITSVASIHIIPSLPPSTHPMCSFFFRSGLTPVLLISSSYRCPIRFWHPGSVSISCFLLLCYLHPPPLSTTGVTSSSRLVTISPLASVMPEPKTLQSYNALRDSASCSTNIYARAL